MHACMYTHTPIYMGLLAPQNSCPRINVMHVCVCVCMCMHMYEIDVFSLCMHACTHTPIYMGLLLKCTPPTCQIQTHNGYSLCMHVHTRIHVCPLNVLLTLAKYKHMSCIHLYTCHVCVYLYGYSLSMHVHTHMFIHACIHTHKHTCVCMHSAHTQTHMCMHACTHAHTHMYTFPSSVY